MRNAESQGAITKIQYIIMDGNVVYMYKTLSVNADDYVVCMSSLYPYVTVHAKTDLAQHISRIALFVSV